MNRARALAGRDATPPVRLSIKALPVDEDPHAMAIARQLARWFGAVGIGTGTTPMTAEALYRSTLFNLDFDVFVGRYPYRPVTPDSLYTLLHSSFSAEPGWQNPFGYTNLEMDDLLVAQRRARPGQRASTVADIQRKVATECPFVVLGRPTELRAVQTDQFEGWDRALGRFPFSLFALDRTDFTAKTLRLTTTDSRPTSNLNPLLAPFRGHGPITDLIFEPLVRQFGGERYPWLATDVTWTERDGRPTPTVTLREGLRWHDGEPVTATDVATTYDLFADTSLGERDQPLPTTRYRGRSSLVEETTVRDDRTVELTFTETSRSVARRALSLPILPAHVWRERTDEAKVAGLDLGAPTTEALVTSATPPVGSGPFAFESATERTALHLSRFDDHFLFDGAPNWLPSPLTEGSPFEHLQLTFVGSDSTAVDLVATGAADATATGIGPDHVRTVGETDALSLVTQQSDAFYFVGFNARRAPLGNPRFRRLLAHLVDREYLDDAVFDHYLEPAVSPLSDSENVPDDIRWDGHDPVTPFLGTGGTVDESRAREMAQTAGYRYDQQGRLRRT